MLEGRVCRTCKDHTFRGGSNPQVVEGRVCRTWKGLNIVGEARTPKCLKVGLIAPANVSSLAEVHPKCLRVGLVEPVGPRKCRGFPNPLLRVGLVGPRRASQCWGSSHAQAFESRFDRPCRRRKFGGCSPQVFEGRAGRALCMGTS